MDYQEYCCLCNKQDDLIEISTNSLLIDKKCFDFGTIFKELLQISDPDSELDTNYICEACKDHLVQFFLFKKSANIKPNPHQQMIINQIESFLENKNLEQIELIRKINSVSLVYSPPAIPATTNVAIECTIDEEIHQSGIDKYEEQTTLDNEDTIQSESDEYERNSEEAYESADEDEPIKHYQCRKCDKSLSSSADFDVHHFRSHTIVGFQMENEAINNQTFFETEMGLAGIWNCERCSTDFYCDSLFIQHLILNHINDILSSINESFDIKQELTNSGSISSYLNYIANILSSESQSMNEIEDDIKNAFLNIYSCENIEMVEVPNDHREDNFEAEQIEIETSNIIETPIKDEDRAWIRQQINTCKEIVRLESGETKVLYRCSLCATFTANSAPSFRYHLANKHLKENDRMLIEDSKVDSQIIRTVRTNKNVCIECSLKFKDQRSFNAHIGFHELFEIVAQHTVFPICHTCNSVFIDEEGLEKHLARHSSNKNILEPIIVPIGAIQSQGKVVKVLGNKPAQECLSDDKSLWKCGHCLQERFEKEINCRYHILIRHSSCFTCPIDKREFEGYKAVSLYSQHLKNKHSTLFPQLSFPCTFCQISFPSIYEKLFHMKNCNEKKFCCDHCGKKFFKKGELTSHLKFISGETFFECSDCGKKCETASDLKIHVRSHTKEKPFSCSLCTKSFRTLAARSAHLETHSPSSSCFTCEYCPKTFRQRQMYRRHVKAVHEEGQKVYECTQCFKQLSRLHILKQHLLKVHSLQTLDATSGYDG